MIHAEHKGYGVEMSKNMSKWNASEMFKLLVGKEDGKICF